MFYKPTYCCSCGDKIERIDWKLLSSRRFCELCETEYKFEDWLPRIAGAIALVFGIWGFGNYFSTNGHAIEISRGETTANAKLGSSEEKKSTLQKPAVKAELKESSAEKTRSDKVSERTGQLGSARKETISLPVAKKVEKSRVVREVSEPGYFCGAETKKGKPCSRKVKGKKRCWQHEGRKAMLPQKDLAVGDNR